jgi:biotin carboxylase
MVGCILAKTLMIVGGGEEQIPAYILARKKGLRVVGSDLNPNAPALKYANDVLITSTRNAAETASKALEYHRQHSISGVMTIANDVPYTVARVASSIGLPSISLDAASNVSDKLLMKQCFSEHKIACPWFTELKNLKELIHIVGKCPDEHFVIKPVDGRGARGVLLIDSGTDLEWAIQESAKWGDSGRLILEKYIPGIQLSTESFLLNGRCYTPAIAERNYARLEQFLPNIIEDGGTIPANIGEEMRNQIDDLVLKGAQSLGIENGIIKGDIVIDQTGRPMIIELAARLSGGWFSTHQIPAATGVDLVEVVMDHALGVPISENRLVAAFHHSTAIRYWYPPAGLILSIKGEDTLKKTPGLISYGFFRKPGEKQPQIKMHPDRFGYVIVKAQSRELALIQVQTALESIEIDIALE